MSRNRLAVTKLNDFVDYCVALGWESRPTKGHYEVARLKRGKQITIVYARSKNDAGSDLTHLTLDRVGDVLFWQWKLKGT